MPVLMAGNAMLAPLATQAAVSSCPAARKIAPHTPPPRISELLAALTMALTGSWVMSEQKGARFASPLFTRPPSRAARPPLKQRRQP